MFNAIKTSVIIVNYKNIDETLACLSSLIGLTSLPQYIFVVDNASTEASLVQLSRAWTELFSSHGLPNPEVIDKNNDYIPRVALLPLKANTGFAGGNNAALSLLLKTECTGFWLLNNDAIVDPDALEQLCTTSNNVKKPGICGSTVFYAELPQVVQCTAGGRLQPLTGKTEPLFEGYSHSEITQLSQHKVEQSLDWITGCSFFISRSALETVGLLPEHYFLYYEDVAFSRSVALSGFDLAWAPKSFIYHAEGGSTGAKGKTQKPSIERSEPIDYLVIRNRFFFMKKFYPFYLPIAILSLSGVLWNRVRRRQGNRFLLLLRAVIDGLTGKMGKPPNFS